VELERRGLGAGGPDPSVREREFFPSLPRSLAAGPESHAFLSFRTVQLFSSDCGRLSHMAESVSWMHRVHCWGSVRLTPHARMAGEEWSKI